ncbi:possible psbY, PSII-Y, photosystem II polypeptide [Ostreococcus lucimarinus CCE9901]|uniref:Possible psbY, PSII-Y, photosystem II polypeptide n=1 Tax=Ostreococcus lucimarinus (strain CCE9901) TaxID=436017 RepID=A4S5C8_OSTLU|nr:possible psbY, PSII-Y, photosystem II polypeptide [Ostreococcus lucimarinus CCE9901]ABO98878.1 possible psbY, PSII-Y, photosystem II polypeptide [Ostreococcus lucimarinus CCE9901]|eukprot:XP_001420585.1 possible psbY, PSII-Y, photosystem II polypeptide [Ostreococcus lucimarinus CCE9901]
MLTLTRTQITLPARAPARARRTARTAQSARVIARARTSAVVEDEFATDDDVVRRGQTAAMATAASMFFADRADAAQELMQTALDGRPLIFLAVFGPVLGWVAYNILSPGLRQLENMQAVNAKSSKKRAAGALAGGLTASALMGMPEASDAAQNVADLAGIDGRIAIFFVFAPVLGWVAYNILGPGLRQFEDMQKAAAKKKGVLAGAGLSAAALMGMPEASDAAEQLGELAGIDGRIAIFFVFAPVLGWVAYNILGPGLRQFEDMQKAAAKKKGVLAGAGLSAAALMGMPEASDAAQEIGTLAGIDGRIAIFFVFAPVLGWVAYNILGPGLRQFEDMQKAAAKKKGVLAGAGLSAAALMGMPEASDAAEQLGELAGIDGRIAIFFVFAPVLGWVAYNILGPGLRQFEDMQKAAAKKK